MVSPNASDKDKIQTQALMGWSGGSHLLYLAPDEKAFVEVKFPVKKAGKYSVDAVLTKSWDYGAYRCSIDGKPVGRPVDLYSLDVVIGPSVNLGVHELAGGEPVSK